MKSILIVTAASAALFSINAAAEPLSSPRATGSKAVAAASVKDPNLVAGPRIGKRTPDVVLVTAGGAKDADTLATVKHCSMTPRTKDTAACAKHCEVAGK